MREYTIFMLDTYGREFVDELRTLSREVTRYRVDDLLEIEAYYKEALEQLTS